jgi:hypothetical protein
LENRINLVFGCTPWRTQAALRLWRELRDSSGSTRENLVFAVLVIEAEVSESRIKLVIRMDAASRENLVFAIRRGLN